MKLFSMKNPEVSPQPVENKLNPAGQSVTAEQQGIKAAQKRLADQGRQIFTATVVDEVANAVDTLRQTGAAPAPSKAKPETFNLPDLPGPTIHLDEDVEDPAVSFHINPALPVR